MFVVCNTYPLIAFSEAKLLLAASCSMVFVRARLERQDFLMMMEQTGYSRHGAIGWWDWMWMQAWNHGAEQSYGSLPADSGLDGGQHPTAWIYFALQPVIWGHGTTEHNYRGSPRYYPGQFFPQPVHSWPYYGMEVQPRGQNHNNGLVNGQHTEPEAEPHGGC